jgi:hypothetical protein
MTPLQEKFQADFLNKGWALVDISQFDCSFDEPCSYGPKRGCLFADRSIHVAHLPPNILAVHKFLLKLVKKCINKKINFSYLELRKYPRKRKNKRHTSTDLWHQDGGSIRIIIPVQGNSTEFRETKYSKKILTIPKGYALVFTGRDRDRDKATFHRTPKYSSTRKLIVFTSYTLTLHQLLYPKFEKR